MDLINPKPINIAPYPQTTPKRNPAEKAVGQVRSKPYAYY
jgi:hypothetical protein